MEETEFPLFLRIGSINIAGSCANEGGKVAPSPTPYPYLPNDSVELRKVSCSGVNPATGKTKAVETEKENSRR